MRKVPTLLGAALLLILFVGASQARPREMLKGLDLLGKIIGSYNRGAIIRSLKDGTYRGEAGIVRLRPEIAKDFGLAVVIDNSYKLATKLLAESEDVHDEIISELKRKRKGGLKDKDVDKLLTLALSYKEKKTKASNILAAYYKTLRVKQDERLNDKICSSLIRRELAESLRAYHLRLRDALADLYNRTYKGQAIDPPLSPENVGFVNFVFNKFVSSAPHQIIKTYELDTFILGPNDVKPEVWKMIFPPRLRAYAEIVERLYLETDRPRYRVHPVLFMALMRRESNFDPIAVSEVGAAGLTQIMPGTAKLLGMESVYSPSYLRQAAEYLRKARKWRGKAVSLIEEVDERSGSEKIKKAWACMQRANKFAKESKKLFARYEKELLKAGNDDRLDIEKAIRHGYRYFTRMLNKYKGDISLALAAYNAGPSRVREFGGIPPFPETVAFRNTVLQYYDEYLSRLDVKIGRSGG